MELSLFFSLNKFISIIIDSFEKVRSEAKIDPDKFGFLSHIIGKFKRLFGKRETKMTYDEYKNHMDILPSQVDKLINIVIRVI